MTAAVGTELRHRNAQTPCPVCGGHAALRQGQGVRCYGFTTDDAVFCTRVESERRSESADAWAHDRNGKCHCGTTHGLPEPFECPDPVRQPPSVGERIVDTYVYRDMHDRPVYRVIRYEPKTFRQQHAIYRGPGEVEWRNGLGDAERVLWNLRAVDWARDTGAPIWFVEGEKDALTAQQWFSDLELSDTATCHCGGTSGWRDEYADAVAGAKFIRIVQDRDDPGRKWAQKVLRAVRRTAPTAEVVIYQAALDVKGADFSDHEAAGFGLEDLEEVYRFEGDAPPLVRQQRDAIAADVAQVTQLSEADMGQQAESALRWPSSVGGLEDFRGFTILSGQTGSAKSVVAMGSSLEAANRGVRVLYFSAELSVSHLRDRLKRYWGDGLLPESWHFYAVGMNTPFDVVKDAISAHCDGTPLLVVFDSVNTMVANEEDPTEGDVFQLGAVGKRVMWARNAVSLSDGLLGVLMVSEASKTGEMKGRFSFRADMAVSFEKDTKDFKQIEVVVVKNWSGPSGPVGTYHLDTDAMRLRLPGGFGA